jgi:hypothetical protein
MEQLKQKLKQMEQKNTQLQQSLQYSQIQIETLNAQLQNSNSVNSNTVPTPIPADVSEIQNSHTQELQRIEQAHSTELQHALSFKLLFAEVSAKREDLETLLHLEKQKNLTHQNTIHCLLSEQKSLQLQEQTLVTQLATLAQTCIENGISVKTATNLSNTNHNNHISSTLSTPSRSNIPHRSIPNTAPNIRTRAGSVLTPSTVAAGDELPVPNFDSVQNPISPLQHDRRVRTELNEQPTQMKSPTNNNRTWSLFSKFSGS